MLQLIVSLFLLIFASSSSAFGGEVHIGVSLSLSGKYEKMAKMQEKGFRLWAELANKKGGLLDQQIRLHIYDDRSDPATAAQLYSQMIKEDKVDLVFGPYSSNISKAVLPVTEKHKYPVLLSGASADSLWEQSYEYAFGVYTPASKYTVGFLEMLTRNKIQNIAILSVADPFSKTLAINTKKWADKFRLRVSYSKELNQKEDVLRVIKQAKQAKTQAIIVCGHLKESIEFAKALHDINWKPKAFYSSVGPATKAYYDVLGDMANLSFSSSQWEPSVGAHFPRGQEFIDAFTEISGTTPSYHAATAFAAGMILQAAVDITASLDREQLKYTFSSMDTMTLIGRYGVDRSGWQIRHFPLIIQWQNGKKHVVWPEKLKNADPVFN